MNLVLKRNQYSKDGIFSTLFDEIGNVIAVALEHAYDLGSDNWLPKIPPGVYNCQRGFHRLASMKQEFTTYEIMGVRGHSNLLFHCGNFDKDSEGCILLGESRMGLMIVQSRVAFERFMNLQNGINSFTLTVVS